MSEGDVRRGHVERLREVLGDESDGVIHMTALPNGLVRCDHMSTDGVSQSVAMWGGPTDDQEDDEEEEEDDE